MDLDQVESKSNKMTRLTPEQLDNKVNFIKNYINANNAASGSTFDANSNVTNKNVATMLAELHKDFNIQIKRALASEKIKEQFGEWYADKYIEQLENHLIYCHDETSGFLPYCAAVTIYPFIMNGLRDLGGDAAPPKHLSSYCGGFINLVFALSSQFAGAIATPEWLFYFHYFAVKDYGKDYLTTHRKEIIQEIQSVVYALNQPASARNYQSVFWNISIFDRYYFESLLGKMYYPDGTQCDWDTYDGLQRLFMQWFNKERTKALLTFPVVTVTLYNNGTEAMDKAYFDFTCEELSHGNSFFIYTSKSIDSLSSCCFSGNEKITVLNNSIKAEARTVTIADYVNGYSLGEEIDSKYNTDDYILSYDTSTDVFVPTRIVGLLKKKYNGRLIVFKVGSDYIKVTPDHEFWVRDKETHECTKIRADELVCIYNLYEIFHDKEDDIEYKEIVKAYYTPSEEDSYVYDIELEENHYFFANNILSHNCRLRNDISDQINDFSYSLGAGGIMTGSMNVLTLNMNRFIQDCYREYQNTPAEHSVFSFIYKYFTAKLCEQIKLMHKFQIGFKLLFKDLESKGMLPAYTAHYIDLDKQYLTIGINGLMEGLEYLGYKPSNNMEYKRTLAYILKVISNTNKESVKEYPELKLKFNCEEVPAESLGVKFAKWDKKDNYAVPRDCYNSYFYPVEDDRLSVIDKFCMYGELVSNSMDGGSAYHANLAETPTKEVFKELVNVAIKEGCPYFCFNIKVTCCNNCGYIDKRTLTHCSKCGSTNIDYATRTIGYLKKISNFSKERQEEESRRAYTKC